MTDDGSNGRADTAVLPRAEGAHAARRRQPTREPGRSSGRGQGLSAVAARGQGARGRHPVLRREIAFADAVRRLLGA